MSILHLDRGDGVRLAAATLPGRTASVVFLPGFMSDMTGDKAIAVETWCRVHGQACLRLDYSGHGQSGGEFVNGTIGRWTDDALFLIDRLAGEKFLVIGSSMGGWIALNVALARPDRVVGFIGIAAAPDFTEDLMWSGMSPASRMALEHDGKLRIPSAYGGEQIITKNLIDEGRRHLLLRGPIPFHGKVRLLHGMLDPDVPWQTAMRLAETLESPDVQTILIKDAEHRLSRPQDIALLLQTVASLLGEDGS